MTNRRLTRNILVPWKPGERIYIRRVFIYRQEYRASRFYMVFTMSGSFSRYLQAADREAAKRFIARPRRPRNERRSARMSWIEDYNYWLTAKEQIVINETMAHHDLSVLQRTEARFQILQEAKKGGRFYAYSVTHRICAKLQREGLPGAGSKRDNRTGEDNA